MSPSRGWRRLRGQMRPFLIAASAACMFVVPLAGRQAPQTSAADMAPNPYAPAPFRLVPNWPAATVRWGPAFNVEPDGRGGIWIAHRGWPSIVKVDARTGAVLSSFGARGTFAAPHGLGLDAAGNVYVTDCPGGRGADEDALKAGKGYQVFKFTPDGTLLMTLGKAGVSRPGQDTFVCPTDIVVADNGDFFVSDGHDNTPKHYGDRVAKFRADGTFIKDVAQQGSGPGQVFEPHGLAMDSRGRLFIADRMNDRVQILDQDGRFLDIWKQFGRTGGIYVNRQTDLLYVTDANSTPQNHPGWPRGIRIATAGNGAVLFFIPGTEPEGVAADADGHVYAAVTHGRLLEKYEYVPR